MIETNRILCGDAYYVLKTLPDCCVNLCVTSPPYYGLRDYGVEGQVGLEQSPDEYAARLTEIFSEVRRVLTPDGILFLIIADSYAGSGKGSCKDIHQKWSRIKQKDMMGIPWSVAFALREDGWYLRSDIIWNKPNAFPHSVKDRPVSSYEHIFLLAKSSKYYFNYKALEVPTAEATKQRYKRNFGSNKYSSGIPGQKMQGINRPNKKVNDVPEMRRGRDIWNIATSPYRGAHFAAFPIELARRCILAGCPEGGIVLDPFFGSGTTGAAAVMHGRNYIGIELNPEYIPLAEERINKQKKDESNER